MPPIAIVFFLTGIAVWANALYFLGVAAQRAEGGSDPVKAVGWITLVAGLSDFLQVLVIGSGNNLLGGLVVFYAAFFTLLGIAEIAGPASASRRACDCNRTAASSASSAVRAPRAAASSHARDCRNLPTSAWTRDWIGASSSMIAAWPR